MFSSCFSKQHVYKSMWQKTPVNIYGNEKYVPAQFFTDADTKVNYSVSNDSNYLYIFLETNYDATVSGITQRGLQIWIDTTGKKNHQVGILCPLPQKPQYPDGTNQRQKRNWNTGNTDTTLKNNTHRLFLERTKQMHVSGFKTLPDGLIELPDTLGINLGVIWDNSNDLEFETAISLKSFLKYRLLPSDSSKIIDISFNFTSIPKRKHNDGSGVYPAFGLGMGIMGVMMGGGNGGSGSDEPEAETIWKPFHLSTIPK